MITRVGQVAWQRGHTPASVCELEIFPGLGRTTGIGIWPSTIQAVSVLPYPVPWFLSSNPPEGHQGHCDLIPSYFFSSLFTSSFYTSRFKSSPLEAHKGKRLSQGGFCWIHIEGWCEIYILCGLASMMPVNKVYSVHVLHQQSLHDQLILLCCASSLQGLVVE